MDRVIIRTIISISLLILTVIFIGFISQEKITEVFATSNQIESNKVILIDPGHGGIDGGAVSINGVLEKHINLSISLLVRDKLQESGYKVILTRSCDKGLYTKSRDINAMKREDLDNRCKMKRDSNCHLFISIHQNFFTQSNCSGAQIWYSKNEESKNLAHMLQENLKKDLNTYNREEKAANDSYKILRCYKNTPSVIVECGFLTNPKEEKKLISKEYQDKIATSIVNSINEYFLAKEPAN